MAQEFILHEGTLNDNCLIVPSKGKVFKGGYIALIKEYTFATSWTNKLNVKRFRSKERLQKYLDQNYPETSSEFDFTGTELE